MRAQQLERFWNSCERVLLTFKFERDVALEAGGLHDSRYTGIVEVESIPASAPKVGLALHENSSVGQLRQPVVWILEEIPGIEGHLKPL